MRWSDEDINKLKILLNKGESFAVISKQLGCSRNAAIGIATRLKLKSKNSPAGKGLKKGKKENSFKETTKPIIKETKPVIPKKKHKYRVRLPKEFHDDKFFEEFMKSKHLPYTIYDIPAFNECKFITGDVKNGSGKWCRKPVVPAKNWCEHHLKRVYIGFPVRKR